MELKFKTHETHEKRENEIKSELTEKATPVYIVSCRDGILLATASTKLKGRKISRVLDRAVFAGVGSVADCRALYEPANSYAKIQAHVERSQGDVFFVVNDIVRSLSSQISHRFKDLFSSHYFQCEISLVVLGREQQDDEIWCIDCSGDDILADGWAKLPMNQTEDEEGDNGELSSDVSSMDMRTVFRDLLAGKLKKYCKNRTSIEAVVLERVMANKKDFKKVYHRLSQEEISDWLK